MSQTVDVRALGNQDVVERQDTLRELLLENARINFPDAEEPVVLAESWFVNLSRFVDDGSAIALGAFEDESLKGVVWAYRREVAGQARIHLGHIVVAVDARSRGLGQRLLEGLESVAHEQGIAIIELMTSADNSAASRFYEASGFVVTRVQMEKDLAASGGGQ